MSHKKIFFSGNPCIIKDYAGQTGRWDARFTIADAADNYTDPDGTRSVDFVVDADTQGLSYDVADFFHYSALYNREPQPYSFGSPVLLKGVLLKAKVRADVQTGLALIRNSEVIYALRGRYEDDNQDFFDVHQAKKKRFLSNIGKHRKLPYYENDFL